MMRLFPVILIPFVLFGCTTDKIDLYEHNLKSLEETYDVNLEVLHNFDSTVDFVHLKNIQDLEEFIIEIQNEIASNVIKKDDILHKLGIYCSCDSFQGSNNLEASYKPTIFTRLNFNFNFINGQLSSLQGYFTGWTFANSYTLINSTVTRSCDSYYIDAKGTYDYLLFVEGIGTLYRQKVTHRINIPCNGGLINVGYYEP